MAKDKKRGFFSWLGFNRQDEDTNIVEHSEEQSIVADEPAAADDAAVIDSSIKSDIDELQAQEQTASIISEPETTSALDLTQTAEANAPEPAYDSALSPLVEPEPEPDAAMLHEILSAPAMAESLSNAANDAPLTASIDEITVAEHENDLAEYQDEVDNGDWTEEEIPAADRDEIADAISEISEVQQDSALDELDEASVKEETEEEPAVMQEQERPTKEGFFARLKRSLLKTKQNLGSGFIGLFRGKRIDDELFEELEEQLLIADVGVSTTSKIIASLTEHADRRDLKDAEALYGKLKEEMSDILKVVDKPLDITTHKPFVILMIGVNGVGKTTTIGKLARQFQAEGKSVMLAAGDTFRAAAVEQLQVWGERNHIPVIAQHTGADSASVIFDAIQAAKSRNVDVLIADTAGRLQNKSHLMEELKKIVRVMKKLDVDAPHEVMLTIDASTGQNAVSQTQLFHEAVGLTGITLTKLDGTAKGGVIFSVADRFAIPIRYIGVGEGIEDLRPFKSDDFIEALFARED